MREEGIRDLGILRAMEAMPRAAFVDPRYAALANRNIALPTDCGQTVPGPLFVARMLSGSRLAAGQRVLVVGLGSGYATAVLAQLETKVVAVDRFETLVDRAAARLAKLGIGNVETRWADGLALPAERGFDRLLIFAALRTLPASIWSMMAEGGAVVHGRAAQANGDRQRLVRVERRGDGIGRQIVLGAGRLAPARSGVVGRG